MSPRTVTAIARRELKSHFDSPAAYVVIIVFLLLWEFLFFQSAFLIGRASLRSLFDLLPWLAILFVPAITMNSVARERDEGTLEVALTQPVRALEFLAGKFLAGLAFFASVLILSLLIPITLAKFGNFDLGELVGQYLASFFYGALLVALGIATSSFFRNAVSSLLVAGAGVFLLTIIGIDFFTQRLPGWLVTVSENLSATSHFDSMSRGVLDLRDLLYFLGGAAAFLAIAYLQIMRAKLGNRPERRSYTLGVGLIIGIVVLVALLGSRIPGRLDLTQEKTYTLSSATKRVVSNLPDVVTITLYASDGLPAQFQPRLREVRDTLRDYRNAGKGLLKIKQVNPDSGASAAQEASAAGVEAIQFNVIGQEEFKVRRGYFGLAVTYTDKKEVIPFVEDAVDLEYQLTSFIDKLTSKERLKVGLVAPAANPFQGQDNFSELKKELEQQYEVETIDLAPASTATSSDPFDGLNAVAFVGLTQTINPTHEVYLRQYLNNGGSVLFAIDGVNINPQTMAVTKNSAVPTELLKNYGAVLNTDLVYDLRSNEPVSFGGGFINYVLPYPLWLRAVAADATPITTSLESVVLGWASSVERASTTATELETKTILQTSPFAGIQKENYQIQPDDQLPASQKDLARRTLAVSIEGKFKPDAANKTRLLVVGDSDILSNRFMQERSPNTGFALAAIEWLSRKEALAGIRAKGLADRRLFFETAQQISLVKYGNFAAAVLIPLGFGTVKLLRRRRMTFEVSADV